MRSHPPRVPAVGGEQYRRTRTKVIHGRSRVVTIIIMEAYFYAFGRFWVVETGLPEIN